MILRESIEPHPVKRTMKLNKIFAAKSVLLLAVFLRSKYHLVLFHWRNSTQITLDEPGIVIVNIIPNAKLVFQLRDSDLCLL